MRTSAIVERFHRDDVTLREIASGLVCARRFISRAEELIDAIEWSLRQQHPNLPWPDPETGRREHEPSDRIAPRRRKPHSGIGAASEDERHKAEKGVGSVRIWPSDNRRHHVSIDGSPPFTMPIAEAALLEALACRQAGDEGLFPPFTRLADIAASRGCSLHSVTMAISRLRERLRSAGLSRLLVETRPHEARFRLRRQEPQVRDTLSVPAADPIEPERRFAHPRAVKRTA